MVNLYTEYVKELLDFVYGLFVVSPDQAVVSFGYRFDDYSTRVSQQQALLDKLEKVGVVKVLSRIDLAPAKQIEMGIHGNEYSAAGCAGYVLELDRDKFMEYRVSTNLVKVSYDEHEYNMPHLSEDKKTLHVNDKEIALSNKNMLLLQLIFEDTDYCCSETLFATTYGGAALDAPTVFTRNAVNYLNNVIKRETQIETFIQRDGEIITLNSKFRG